MIFRAENDYLHLSRQKAFETLRQCHAGKTPTHNHYPFGKVQ
jgi:hypothetical protein